LRRCPPAVSDERLCRSSYGLDGVSLGQIPASADK
jgi:hypothetical protein